MKIDYTETTTLPAWTQAEWTDGKPVYREGEIRWGGKIAPPAIGSRVRVTFNSHGEGVVRGYFTEHGWLGLLVKCDKAPAWLVKQRKERKQPLKDPVHVFGPEFELLAAPAPKSATRWEVQTEMLCEGWVNCWTENAGEPTECMVTFATRAEAEAALERARIEMATLDDVHAMRLAKVNPLRDELLKQVKQYAHDHYEQDGWDFLVECHEDKEIIAAIGQAKTLKGALRNVAKEFALSLHDERRREQWNMGGGEY